MLRGKIVAGLMVAVLAGSAGAATLTVTGAVTAAYDRATFAPVALPDISQPVGVELIYQLDIVFEIADLGGTHPEGGTQEGFGGLSMNLVRSNIGVPADFMVGYVGNTDTIDVNGPVPGGVVSLWLLNEDSGSDKLDLINIAIAASGGMWQGAGDPRLGIGESGPQALGSAFVTWDGVTEASVVIDVLSFGTVNADGLAATDPGGTAIGDTINFVPEPATMTLLGLGAVALVRRRR